jgi:hypothetical protein
VKNLKKKIDTLGEELKEHLKIQEDSKRLKKKLNVMKCSILKMEDNERKIKNLLIEKENE